MERKNRVVVLIDMDCFYCQVEEKLNPDLKGKPIAVVQYNPWKGGGIIAVNYVARARGVSRHMRGDEAKEKCPEIELPSVPCQRGKADISKYRDAGKDVAKVLQKFTTLLERASIDEAYLDITASVNERLKILNINTITREMVPNTYALGYDSVDDFISDVHNYGNGCIDFDDEHAKQLLVGAVIVSEIRAAVYEETGYQCSAGIADNKILAKLVCGMNKPNKQTVLPKHSVNILYKTLPVKKVKHLGGKFGDYVCEVLKIKCMGDLQNFSEKELQSKIDEKNGIWLYNIAHGVDTEPVQARFNPKSIGCCKQFKGKAALLDLNSLTKWLNDLGDEIEDRLEKDGLENNRTPKQMVVSFSMQLQNGVDSSSSRSYNFQPDDELTRELFSSKALELVLESMEGVKVKDEENRILKMPIKFLGISVGKFEENNENKKTKKIKDYFKASSSKDISNSDNLSNELVIIHQKNIDTKNEGKEYLLQKFFNVENNKSESKLNVVSQEVIQSTLDKQESFFAKFLNSSSTENLDPKNTTSDTNDRSTTPLCKVISHGEDSNDSNYTGSTINMEINKSIALFEEDSEEINRVSSMRNLLNSNIVDNNFNKLSEDCKSNSENSFASFCEKCKKYINFEELELHTDYHLALKLRDEEKQVLKYEKSVKGCSINVGKPAQENFTKLDSSIANFMIKIDNNIPTKTCSECGKKVPIEKYSEHLDFHEAQKLNRELNKKSQTSYFRGNSVKRKRHSISPIKKPKVQCKTIDSFFK